MFVTITHVQKKQIGAVALTHFYFNPAYILVVKQKKIIEIINVSV